MRSKSKNVNYVVKEVKGSVKVKGIVFPLIITYGLGFLAGAVANELGGRISKEQEENNEQ